MKFDISRLFQSSIKDLVNQLPSSLFIEHASLHKPCHQGKESNDELRTHVTKSICRTAPSGLSLRHSLLQLHLLVFYHIQASNHAKSVVALEDTTFSRTLFGKISRLQRYLQDGHFSLRSKRCLPLRYDICPISPLLVALARYSRFGMAPSPSASRFRSALTSARLRKVETDEF